MVFVVSMGDLFHPEVPFEFVARMFVVMRSLARHTFLVLTKRPGRLAKFIEWRKSNSSPSKGSEDHIWLGVTIESQRYAAARIHEFFEADWRGVRYVSCEPLSGPVDLSPWLSSLDWVIVGGESGPGARPMDPDWARSIRDQCASTGTAYFFKQFGEWAPVEDEKRLEGAGFGARRKHVFASGNTVWRIGKKAAGRLLDGRLWNEYPDSMTARRVPPQEER
jgi:protein gp37